MYDVALIDCDKYDVDLIKTKINDAVNMLGGWEQFIYPNCKVLLKTNLVSPKIPETGAVTHPILIKAIGQILRDLDCEVWIGDSSGGAITGSSTTKQSFKVSGMQQMAEEEGFIIKNFDAEGVVEKKIKNNKISTLYIAKPMFEADVVINVPKLKTHSATIYTGALKNLYGCIPGLQKSQYHKLFNTPETFADIVVSINSAVDISLNIMDAIVSMDGDGPTGGKPYESHKIIIGCNSLAVDTVASAMIGVKSKNIPILQAAIQRNMGPHNLDEVNIIGDYDKIPILKNFKLPKTTFISKSGLPVMVTSIISSLMKTRPVINLDKCKQCNMCVESCPVQIIDRKTKEIDYDKCIGCLCCHELCVYKAVELKRMNPIVKWFKK